MVCTQQPEVKLTFYQIECLIVQYFDFLTKYNIVKIFQKIIGNDG